MRLRTPRERDVKRFFRDLKKMATSEGVVIEEVKAPKGSGGHFKLFCRREHGKRVHTVVVGGTEQDPRAMKNTRSRFRRIAKRMTP